ncbi:MAG: hypothetical protein A2Y07_01650, partial [Planctomycetes bacterium GWF2_50_10]
YASVEVLDNPSLKDKPVIVGGTADTRGVVAAASYAVRKFGVRSAMPIKTAVKLCPQAIILPVRMGRYKEISERIHEIFGRYTPLVEPISIDEAFLDVTGCPGTPEQIGRAIKDDIKKETGLTASVGIAQNKFLAKLASDLKKPDGFVVITDENKQGILDPLPVSAIYGIGKVSEKKLNSLGIRTIAQLRTHSVEHLKGVLGSFASDVLDLARGIDDRPVELPGQAKSISSEETFATDISDKDQLLKVLYGQVQEVAKQLRDDDLAAKSIHLKLRYGDFQTITRAKTFDEPTSTTDVLWDGAKSIFEQWHKTEAGALRLLGFCAAGLMKVEQQQLMLFDSQQGTKKSNIDRAMDEIQKKYGADAIKRKL